MASVVAVVMLLLLLLLLPALELLLVAVVVLVVPAGVGIRCFWRSFCSNSTCSIEVRRSQPPTTTRPPLLLLLAPSLSSGARSKDLQPCLSTLQCANAIAFSVSMVSTCSRLRWCGSCEFKKFFCDSCALINSLLIFCRSAGRTMEASGGGTFFPFFVCKGL